MVDVSAITYKYMIQSAMRVRNTSRVMYLETKDRILLYEWG